ncbi:hypothetical protein ACC668_38060, partial [Rhizobium ruizarguesonis]
MRVATADTASIVYITLRSPFLSDSTPPKARKMLPGTGPAFGITPVIFIVVIFVLGLFMSLGKADVYKHIPAYYPEN